MTRKQIIAYAIDFIAFLWFSSILEDHGIRWLTKDGAILFILLYIMCICSRHEMKD